MKKKKVNITVEKNKVLYTQKQEHKTENHMWQFNLYDKHKWKTCSWLFKTEESMSFIFFNHGSMRIV